MTLVAIPALTAEAAQRAASQIPGAWYGYRCCLKRFRWFIYYIEA